MAPRGGYQPPANPAPVSGPGRLSKRTDGQPVRDIPNADYGEQATFRAAQQGAPMATTPGPQQGQVSPADLSQVVPLNAPTGRADEPVTAGADAGAGPGMSSLGLNTGGNDPSVAYLRRILPALELMANTPYAGEAARAFVRQVRANL